MKKLLISISLLLISIAIQAQKSYVSGTIKGFKNDTLSIMFLRIGETPIIDQVICRNEKLTYEVQLNSPLPYFVRITCKSWGNRFSGNAYPFQFEMDDINFFLQKGEQIKFTAEPGPNGIFLQVFGSPVNEQRNEILKKLFPLHQELNAACMKYANSKKLQDSLQTKKNSLLPEKITKQISSQTIDFILKHPDWEISAEVLMGLPTDSCYKYFKILSPNVKSSYFGKYAAELLYSMKPGDKVVQFTLPDNQGKSVSLSDFAGKYIVLEFWGTWCGWCVKDIPTMKQYHEKYKSMIEFVSIACRDNNKNWKEAIEKYKMDWVNLLNNDEQLAKSYGIEGYPTKMIINPEGIVVGKYLGEGRDFYSELDRMFEN